MSESERHRRHVGPPGLEKLCHFLLASLLTTNLPIHLGTAAEPRFETAVVKPYDASKTLYLGCYVGPGMLQYNCSGTVPRLVAEALSMDTGYGSDDYSYKPSGPKYTITAKLSEPSLREHIDDMLGRFLHDKMGIRYHLEKRPVKAEFLTVVSPALLKQLPVSHDPVLPATEFISFGAPAGLTIPRFKQFVVQHLTDSRYVTTVACTNINFRLFAQVLRRFYGVPVIDDTHLTQRFNFEFTTKAEGPGAAMNLSEVRQALSRFGIRLVARTGVDFVMVDQVGDAASFLN